MTITLQFFDQCGVKGWNFGNRYSWREALKSSHESNEMRLQRDPLPRWENTRGKG